MNCLTCTNIGGRKINVLKITALFMAVIFSLKMQRVGNKFFLLCLVQNDLSLLRMLF